MKTCSSVGTNKGAAVWVSALAAASIILFIWTAAALSPALADPMQPPVQRVALGGQQPSSRPILQASAEKIWTMDEARLEGFSQARPWIDLSKYPAKDPHYPLHALARRQHQERVGSRILTYFENGYYSVSEANGDRGFYYTPNGNLYAVDFDATDTFPIKSYKHHFPSGRLLNVSISVKPGEDFVFDARGGLVSHWLGESCFDAEGRLLTSRSSMLQGNQ